MIFHGQEILGSVWGPYFRIGSLLLRHIWAAAHSGISSPCFTRRQKSIGTRKRRSRNSQEPWVRLWGKASCFIPSSNWRRTSQEFQGGRIQGYDCQTTLSWSESLLPCPIAGITLTHMSCELFDSLISVPLPSRHLAKQKLDLQMWGAPQIWCT